MMIFQRRLLVACFMLTASAAAADEKEVISYEEQIKPIFRQHCVACHGEDKQTADLNPLVAVAGQEHVRLINIETQEDVGRIAFPEGIPHVIRFSRDGGVLMVAGGRPVQSGKVVLFDVKTGKRLASIGDEVDSVMAADLSPDQQLVALGGSGKVVKVYSTVDGRRSLLEDRRQ